MSSILRSKFFPFLIVAIIAVLVEVLARVTPVYKFEKSEAALVEGTRLQILSGKNQYRVIIFGDSRSMSLNPRYNTNAFDDTYNFSLPAMGPRYFKNYLQKYLAAGNKKPEAVLFAASPLLVTSGKGQVLIDPELAAYTTTDMSLFSYLWQRGPHRLLGLKTELTRRPADYTAEELNWNFFSGRFLRMFNISDVVKEFRGPERLYLISAMIPMQFATYRYRNGIANALDPVNYRFENNGHGLATCNCSISETKFCKPPRSYYQDNLQVEESRKRNAGMYNISDRIPADMIMMMKLTRDSAIEKLAAQSKGRSGNDYSRTEDFINYLNENGIELFYLMMPFPDYFKDSLSITSFNEDFAKVIDRHQNAHRLWFPHQFQSPDSYSDQVHLNCQGADEMNTEFTRYVLPELYTKLNQIRNARSTKDNQ